MRTVEIYFDYASPWAYLMSELVEKKLPGVPVVWRPAYVRGLEPFVSGLPYGPLKLAYLMHDVQRVAAYEGVPIAAPATFPIDGLHALRGAIIAENAGAFDRYHRAMFRATWRDARQITQKETVVEILGECIGNPVDVEALGASPIKARLRESTSTAIDKGIFGVPTFVVGDEIFWGLHRVDYVLRAAQAP